MAERSTRPVGLPSVPVLDCRGVLSSDCLRAFGAATIGCDCVDFDIADHEDTLRDIRRLRPRLIVNCAAATDVDRCELAHEYADRANTIDNAAEVAARVRESGARLLLVGISSPRKEFFLAENLDLMGPLLAVGVGGSFDIWAGKTKRAPEWMQRAGLEWFYRLIQEPRRMWKRYLVGNFRFLLLVLRERMR